MQQSRTQTSMHMHILVQSIYAHIQYNMYAMLQHVCAFNERRYATRHAFDMQAAAGDLQPYTCPGYKSVRMTMGCVLKIGMDTVLYEEIIIFIE